MGRRFGLRLGHLESGFEFQKGGLRFELAEEQLLVSFEFQLGLSHSG